MGIFPPQTDDRLVGTTDMGSFTADQNGILGEKLEDIRANAGGIAKASGSGYQVVPSAASGVTVTPGNSWANGSYAEITSGLGSAISLIVVFVESSSSNDQFEIDIATGGAGAETVIATLPGDSVSGGFPQWMLMPFPIDIAASTRIAARARRSGTAVTLTVKLVYVEQSDLG